MDLMRKLERALTAAAFAEENLPELARELLEEPLAAQPAASRQPARPSPHGQPLLDTK